MLWLAPVIIDFISGSGQSTEEVKGETRDVFECFWLLLECYSRFLSALQQNRAQSRLLCLFYNKESVKFPKNYFQFSKQTLFPKRTTVLSACSILSESNQNPCQNGSNSLIGCTRLKLSKMSNHQSSYSAIFYKLK